LRRLLAVAAVAAALTSAFAGARAASAAVGPAPLLAYYYIWFDATSWTRAKRDFPLVGRYSSDQRGVMATQVSEARRAGIDGFIVSWKHTPTLDRRLSTLISVAARQHFKLAVIYEGLDFHRNPLSEQRVASDLSYFATHFAHYKVFQLYDKPLVIWSGTWRFSPDQVEAAAGPVRSKLLVLASEKNVAGYERVAPFVDGDAYYWSSVNPDTYPNYPGKLDAMSAAVHARSGLWIAPAAPGFDARLIGGTTVVPRRGGATLRRELGAALASGPDAIGLISWNEWTENSEVEPSVRYGYRSLRVIAAFRGVADRFPSTVDSSEGAGGGKSYGPAVLIALAVLAFVVVVGVARRTRAGPAPGGAGPRTLSGRRRTRSP
jgi:hypothetical protein